MRVHTDKIELLVIRESGNHITRLVTRSFHRRPLITKYSTYEIPLYATEENAAAKLKFERNSSLLLYGTVPPRENFHSARIRVYTVS